MWQRVDGSVCGRELMAGLIKKNATITLLKRSHKLAQAHNNSQIVPLSLTFSLSLVLVAMMRSKEFTTSRSILMLILSLTFLLRSGTFGLCSLSLHSCRYTHSHTHYHLYFCYDVIKGIHDLKIYSHADSLILSLHSL